MNCELCGCNINTGREYGTNTPDGRSHRTKHHVIPKRFLRSIFNSAGVKQNLINLCYECHEELLHNPILTKDSINKLHDIFSKSGCLEENGKPQDKKQIKKRIEKFQAVIEAGLEKLDGVNIS